MGEIPIGFSFELTDDGGIIRNTNAVGVVTNEITMTEENLYALRTAIETWRDRKWSSLRGATGQAQPIQVHWVARLGYASDALYENVLLTVEGPSGAEMILAVPLSVSEQLAQALPNLHAQMRALQNQTKQ
jgi:hypothetical protein